jgi:hypothetical protein
MSGLYNVLFGQHAKADELLAVLGVTPAQIPRYRSCYWDGEHIVIHTRTGGGNRDYYESKNADNEEGPWNEDLRKIPGFLHDEDDNFDETYADFYYEPPSVALDALRVLPPDIAPAEQWKAIFNALDGKKP